MKSSIVFTGDINFSDAYFDPGFGVGTSISNGLNPFTHIPINSDEYWVGNCECVVSDLSIHNDLKSQQFRISPDSLNQFRHLDCYAISNNHVMQHGKNAYQSMMQYFDNKGINTIGSIDKPYNIVEIGTKKVAILSFSQRIEQFSGEDCPYLYRPEYSELIFLIRKIKKECDYLVAYVHWGNEFINRPYNDQVQFAHLLVDVGIDLIVGMHPHVLQGFEIYKEKYIFYSIGNFVFNMPVQETRYSSIVRLSFDEYDRMQISYNYIYIGNDYFPIVVSENEIPEKFTFKKLNKLLEDVMNNEEYYDLARRSYKRYRLRNNLSIVKTLPKFGLKELLFIFEDFLKRRI